MQRALAHALLLAGLALAAPAPAQIAGMPTPAVQAESHILSAFTTRTDPRVLADSVALGPALRGQVGDEKDGRRIYDALMAGVAGKSLSSRGLSIAEAVQYTSLGVNSADPVVLVEAGDVRLLMQYSVAGKQVAFVEQLAGSPIALPMIQDVPKPEPIVERPLPIELPPRPFRPRGRDAQAAPVATPKPPNASRSPPPLALSAETAAARRMRDQAGDVGRRPLELLGTGTGFQPANPRGSGGASFAPTPAPGSGSGVKATRPAGAGGYGSGARLRQRWRLACNPAPRNA